MMMLKSLFLLFLTQTCEAFAPLGIVRRQTSRTSLYDTATSTSDSVIESLDEQDLQFDVGSGGVRLAQEAVIVISGTVKGEKSNLSSLKRYTSLKQLNDSTTPTVLAVGRGTEDFVDPGTGSTAQVIFAPLQAIQDAANSLDASKTTADLVVNFLGGDDLQVPQVLQALSSCVALGKQKITFHSLAFADFPTGQVTVTIMEGGLEGVNSQVYFHDGKYWTVAEEDLNTALA
jgi:hypothetical protein